MHGKKADAGKLKYNLVPPLALAAMTEVLTFGDVKYEGHENWRNVPDGIERYKSALMRHFEAYRAGEERDEESGCHHLACVMANAAFLYELEVEKTMQEATEWANETREESKHDYIYISDTLTGMETRALYCRQGNSYAVDLLNVDGPWSITGGSGESPHSLSSRLIDDYLIAKEQKCD